MKKDNVKRNHHYVWQYYLQTWTLGNSRILCLHKDRKELFTNSTGKLAFEKDFYKVAPLTVEDLFFIKKLATNKKPNDMFLALNNWNGVFGLSSNVQSWGKAFHAENYNYRTQV